MFFCLFTGLIAFSTVYGESKKELEQKKKALQKDIKQTNSLLNETRQTKKTSISQLSILNKKISSRSNLIHTINTELNILDDNIQSTASNIDSLAGRSAELKKIYSDLLVAEYKNHGSVSRLSFVFAADDFNQAYKRMRYLQAMREYRLKQKRQIIQCEDSLSTRRKSLEHSKSEKNSLLSEKKSELNTLDKEKKEKVKMVSNLTSRETALRQQLRAKQKEESKLNQLIANAIKAEIEAARLAALKKKENTREANASSNTSKAASAVLLNTPEAIRLSENFEGNRGRLPWPVEQGYISSGFGIRHHPLWKEVIINNSGVDIQSAKNARVRSLFEGKVSRVIVIMNKLAVIVQHGEYFTVYSNLKEVFVKAGDKISIKQDIGVLQLDEEENKSVLHLEIWKGSQKMDPELWLAASR